MASAGAYAYIADYNQGLRVVDVSDPALPDEVGFYQTPGIAFAVVVQRSKAYIAEYRSGLRVASVANPAQPLDFGFQATPGYALDVAVDGEYVYIADADGGLSIFRYQTHKVYLPTVLRAQ